MFSKILAELNIPQKCKNYRLNLWQCPHFIFPMLGLIIIAAIILAYIIGQEYIEDPLSVALIVLILSSVLMFLNYLITQSFEKLAEVSKMRADFIHIVSHQLRAPLSNFKWGVEALLEAFNNKNAKGQVEYMDILRDNTERMLELVSELLTVSRLEEGRLPLKIEGLDLEKIADKVLKRFAAYAKAANVNLGFESPHNLPRVFADGMLIQQVIEAFLDNAIKYGGREVKVSLNFEKPSKQVKFEVRDTGKGISPEERKYIFEKFFRGEQAKKIVPDGTGVGLFIAKEIIERHRGRVGFFANKEGGSTFWFALPAAKGL